MEVFVKLEAYDTIIDREQFFELLALHDLLTRLKEIGETRCSRR